eukprot:455483_1
MMSVAGVLRGYLRARNCNLFSCDDFQQLCNIHGQISKQKHTINNDINIPSKTFDNFLHLIEHHHNPQEIKIILDKLKTNNIDPCKTYKWKGPDRKVFGTKILTLYHVTDEKSAESIFKQNKMKCSKGMFGGGIYFAESPKDAHYKALRTGVLITAKVFVGNEYNAKDGSAGYFDFKSLQELGFDSLYVPNGSGSGSVQRVVYNSDQVYLIKKETYKPPPDIKYVELIGQTGAGKTTFLNSMYNYLHQVVDDKNTENSKDITKSQTQEITSYHSRNLESTSYDLTFLDTTGFGDTQGPQQDMKIRNKLKDFFQNIPSIDGNQSLLTIVFCASQKGVKIEDDFIVKLQFECI